jgi:hypothetical protein
MKKYLFLYDPEYIDTEYIPDKKTYDKIINNFKESELPINEKCIGINVACEGIECEYCEPYVSYYVNDSSIKYKLSYTQWYAVDHLSVDSDNHHQDFNTAEEALQEYKKLKAKNTSKDWPRNNFKLIEYRDLKLSD